MINSGPVSTSHLETSDPHRDCTGPPPPHVLRDDTVLHSRHCLQLNPPLRCTVRAHTELTRNSAVELLLVSFAMSSISPSKDVSLPYRTSKLSCNVGSPSPQRSECQALCAEPSLISSSPLCASSAPIACEASRSVCTRACSMHYVLCAAFHLPYM